MNARRGASAVVVVVFVSCSIANAIGRLNAKKKGERGGCIDAEREENRHVTRRAPCRTGYQKKDEMAGSLALGGYRLDKARKKEKRLERKRKKRRVK